MLTGNRHNEFRAHKFPFILLIFQNMVNRSTCPMAALQIPCFLLTVHMVFRHMIRCRGRDLLFIQDFAMVPVLLPCNASSKINRTYRLATGSRIGYDSRSGPTGIKRAVSSEIHSFFCITWSAAAILAERSRL